MREDLRRVRSQRRAGPTRRRKPSRALPLLALVLGLAALVGLVYACRSLVAAPSLRTRSIAISGPERTTEDQIRSEVQHVLGQPLLLVDLDVLRTRVEGLPGIRRASVSRRLPQCLDVHVVEETAVARTTLGEQPLLVSGDGVLFPHGRGLDSDERLPVLTGLATGRGAVALEAADKAALEVIAGYERATGRRLPSGSVVDLSRGRGIELRTGVAGTTLILDHGDPLANLEHLGALEPQVASLAQGRAIDLRFPDRITLVPARSSRARRLN